MPCATGTLAVDEAGVRWRFDDGAEIDLDWPGIVAWADDGDDAIDLLDAIGTGHVLQIDGDADALRAAFAAKCPGKRHG